jgi:hypothetical protein
MQDGRGLRHGPTKADLTTLVRMETPVIYFYTNREMDITAEVKFPKGRITEWYPQARSVAAGINWGSLKLAPDAAFNLPVDSSNNHYYAAAKLTRRRFRYAARMAGLWSRKNFFSIAAPGPSNCQSQLS